MPLTTRHSVVVNRHGDRVNACINPKPHLPPSIRLKSCMNRCGRRSPPSTVMNWTQLVPKRRHCSSQDPWHCPSAAWIVGSTVHHESAAHDSRSLSPRIVRIRERDGDTHQRPDGVAGTFQFHGPVDRWFGPSVDRPSTPDGLHFALDAIIPTPYDLTRRFQGSRSYPRESGGIGIRAGLRIQSRKGSGFDSRLSQFEHTPPARDTSVLPYLPARPKLNS